MWLEALDSGAFGDAARCEDVGSEAAAVNQFPQHARVGESLQVGAGLTESAPDALDVANPEALSDQGVQGDTAGDDVASRLRVPESVAIGQGEFVEHLSLDQRQVMAHASPAARGESADPVGVSVAVQPAARDRPRCRYFLHGPPGAVAIATASTRPRWTGFLESVLNAGSKAATTYPSSTGRSAAARPSSAELCGLRTAPDGVPNISTAVCSLDSGVASRTAIQYPGH
jgi:hypothetical protein